MKVSNLSSPGSRGLESEQKSGIFSIDWTRDGDAAGPAARRALLTYLLLFGRRVVV